MRVGAGPAQNLDWLYEVRNGRAFALGTTRAAAVAAISEVQLFNPIGSAVTIFLFNWLTAVGAATSVDLRIYNTALATLFGNGVNLKIGGAVSVGEIRTAAPAAQDGTFVTSVVGVANQTLPRWPDWMLELGPGEGALLAPNIVNTALSAYALWVER